MKNRVINQLFISLLVMFFGLILSSQKISAASSDDLSFTNYATRDETEYNILPLILDPSLYMVGGPSNKDQLISNMVSDQGYEAQCAKQDWEITPQVYGALEEYFASGHSGVNLGGTTTYNLDLTNTTIPLLRGDEAFEDTKKSSSFEGFFGANKPDPTADETESTGVANLLLTTEQQCIAKSGNLYSAFGENGICDKLKDSDQCSLDYEISGSTLTTKKLFEKIDKLFSKTKDDENFNCSNLTQPWGEDAQRFGVSKSDHELASSAISLMPLNMDRLYRMAFLVIAPEQKPIGDGVFGFLQQNEPEIKRQAPIIVGFKIPYVATNSIESLPLLRDASLLSAYTLTTKENIDLHKQNIVASRNNTIEKIRDNIKNKPSGLIINCDGMSQCADNDGDDTQVLKNSIIEIINGSSSSCSSPLIYEQAGDLGSPANLEEDSKFKKQFFSEILPEKQNSSFTWTAKINNANTREEIKADRIPITAHIVSPIGNNPESDMEFIANSMKIFFTDEQFAVMVEKNCVVDSDNECEVIPEFLTLANTISKLESSTDSFEFFTQAGCEDLPPEEQLDCQKKSIGVAVGENPKKPLVILGGKVGWMIRKVQENLSVLTQKAHDYIASCERTEDLFLGRCQGYLGNPGGSDSSETVADSCNDFRSVSVELPTMNGLEKMVCKAAEGDALDAQLLWGLLQIEGSPFLRKIRTENATEMSCGDIILNSCGASQIVGVLVPQCIDKVGCPQAAYITDDEKLKKEVTLEVACSIEGSLEYILKKRKSETSYLKETYRNATGKEPTEKQLYYMYAARNYGLESEVFVKDACVGAPAVQGCSGKNYCECTMDVFKVSSCS